MTYTVYTLDRLTTSGVKIALQFACGLLLFLCSNATFAQSCPPGYFVTGGAGAYGCAPTSNGGSSTPEPQRPQYTESTVPTLHFSESTKFDTFVAVAWHPNANDVWEIRHNWTQKGATGRVLAACNKVMGGGCTLANWAANGAVVVARDENGVVIKTGTGISAKTAQSDLMRICSDEGKTCRITQGWETSPIDASYRDMDFSQEYYPAQEQVLNTFVYLAWPKIAPPAWKNKTWLASGRGSREMEERVVQKCEDDTGTECTAGQPAMNNVVVAYLFGTDAGFFSSATLDKAVAGIKAKCADKQVTCVIGEAYDSRTPRFTVIDDIH